MSDECTQPHQPIPLQVDLYYNMPAIVLWDGVMAFTASDWTTEGPRLRGIAKAVMLARLYALTEMIEKADEDPEDG